MDLSAEIGRLLPSLWLTISFYTIIETAELLVIFQCLQTISHLPKPLSPEYFLIFMNSLSSIRSISGYNLTKPLTQRIQVILHSLSTTFKKIIFIRIPSNIGIRGNETVDRAAQQATPLPKIKSKILPIPSDLTHYLRQLVLEQWFKYWKEQSLAAQQATLLPKIKSKILPTPSDLTHHLRQLVLKQ